MHTINSEHPSFADHFGKKFQDNIYPSDQSYKKQEEELIEFKEEHHDALRNIHQDPLKTKCLL